MRPEPPKPSHTVTLELPSGEIVRAHVRAETVAEASIRARTLWGDLRRSRLGNLRNRIKVLGIEPFEP